MVQDSGSVPLSVKGVVVGLNAQSMDVVWDVPFISGGTLSDRFVFPHRTFWIRSLMILSRCSQYRGSTVAFNTCLNLSNPQFVTSVNPQAPPPVRPQVPFNPRFGPHPPIQPAPGQKAASGFKPAPAANGQPTVPVKIMMNPNRGRGGAAPWANGHGRGGQAVNGRGRAPNVALAPADSSLAAQSSDAAPSQAAQAPADAAPATASRGGSRGRGGPPSRGGRGFDRGRGSRGAGFRGRGRGASFAPPLPS